MLYENRYDKKAIVKDRSKTIKNLYENHYKKLSIGRNYSL